jgi:hypothetical protein
MVFQAFTAEALAAAGFIGTVALFAVSFDFAFLHGFVLELF